jgi:hypothetical protein
MPILIIATITVKNTTKALLSGSCEAKIIEPPH